MAAMTRPRDEQETGSVSGLVVRLLGALALLAAWGGLVLAAIDAGRAARDGNTLAWLWLALAGAGAAVALAGALLLTAQAIRREPPPRGKHR